MKGVCWLPLLAAVVLLFGAHYAESTAASGDLVLRRIVRSSNNIAGRVKLSVVSPSGVSRSAINLPKLKDLSYLGLAVSGKLAFHAVGPAPVVGQPPSVSTVSLKLSVVDLAPTVPKVIALLNVPTSALSPRANEVCGVQFDESAIAVRKASGIGKGLYRVAMAVTCYDKTGQNCKTRSFVQVFTFNPKTRKLSTNPKLTKYKLAVDLKSPDFCESRGVSVLNNQLSWQAGKLVAYARDDETGREGLYRLTAEKAAPIFVFNEEDTNYGFNGFCLADMIASPASLYAHCTSDFGRRTATTTVVEISSGSGKPRIIAQPLKAIEQSFIALGSNAAAATPLYVLTESVTIPASYRILSGGKKAKSAFKVAFTSRYDQNLQSQVKVVD